MNKKKATKFLQTHPAIRVDRLVDYSVSECRGCGNHTLWGGIHTGQNLEFCTSCGASTEHDYATASSLLTLEE